MAKWAEGHYVSLQRATSAMKFRERQCIIEFVMNVKRTKMHVKKVNHSHLELYFI
jgi:hypothetical protein